MEESLSSGLPSGWEQGAPVAGWGAANIPAGYGTAQPPPGYPLIQQHAHSPYGVADLASRYGTAGSPVAYGTTDPAAAYRALPGPIGYEAANLHSRYGLIDSPQDYRRAIPHTLYDEKGHNSGYSTPDHAVGYAHSEYEKSEPSSGYGRSDSTLHYETTGSHSPYDRSEPSDFARTAPAGGYDRSEIHSEYVKTEPQTGYDRLEPSGYGSSDPVSGCTTTESHAGYENSAPTTEYDATEPATEYDTVESQSRYENPGHPAEFEKSEHNSEYEKSEHPSEYEKSEHPSEYEKSEHPSEYERSEHPEYERSEHPSEYDESEHPSEYEKSEHPSEYEKSEHPSEYDKSEHPSEYEKSEHPSEYEKSEHPSEYEKSEHPSEYEKSEHPSEYEKSEHPSEYEKSEHPSEYEKSDHPSEYEKSNHPSEYDTTEHHSENDKTEHRSEFEKTEASEYAKTEETEHPSEHDITDSTKEKGIKQPASENEGAVSHSIFETSDSSSAWATGDSSPAWTKSDLPPGWERRFIQRQNGKTVDKYYISPTGKRLRSKPEVIKYCQEEGFEVDLELFGFTSRNTGSPLHPPEDDTTEHPSENDEAKESSEIEKTECSNYTKTEETEHPSEHNITDSTTEKDTEEPASEYEGAVSHSIFTPSESSSVWEPTDYSAWEKADLPPGWERKIVERKSGVTAGVRVDIYYISPTGKRLRSKPEVIKWCQEQGLDVDLQLFGFTLKKLGSPAMPGSPAPRERGRSRGRGKPRVSTSKTKGNSRTDREVEKILDHREAGGGDTMYYVKWFGYHDSYNSWELMPSLGPDSADHIEHYWACKEAQSQINQNILQSIMQIHSNGAAEDTNEHVEPEEHTDDIPSYFPQHFLSSEFYEESEPAVKTKSGKARRGRPRAGGRGGNSPVVKQDAGTGRGRPRGRPRKDPGLDYTSGFNADDFTDGTAATSDAMHEDPENLDAGFPAALQCETVMQEGNEENPSMSQENKETELDSGFPAALQCETVMQEENQENPSVSQENTETVPESSNEKNDDTPPETVLVPELADKPRCLVLDKVSGKMHEKEIDAIIAHQTKGVKEIKYFVRYFATLDKEAKGKGHAWIFVSELKDYKELLESYWDKRNASGKVKIGSSTAVQSQRPMQQVNNVGRPAVTKSPAMPASKKVVVEVIDLSDDEGEGKKKNMAKPSQPLGQQRKQQVSSISSWHTPVIDEPNSTKQEEYQVERIMLHRKRNGKTQYLVKWKDYPQSEATWEPEENLKNCKSVLDAYHKRKIEKVVFHRDLGGKREYLIKWEGFFSRHNSWETTETCSHLRDFQTHVNEYWRRKQEEADRKKRNLEECQQYYNTVKERENRSKRPRIEPASSTNKQWVIDSLCKTRDDDMEPGFLIKLCLLNTAINSLRCERCGQQTLQFNKAAESLLSELSIKCTKCPDIRHFSTSEPSKNEPFLDIGGGEYIPLELNAEAQPVPIPVPIKKANEAKCTSNDTNKENTSSGSTKTDDSEVKSVEETEMKVDLKLVEKNEINVNESETTEVKIKKEPDETRISDNSVSDSKEPGSSSSRVTTRDNTKVTEMAASRSTSTTALPKSITQSSTTNIENSNVQQDKEQLPSGCESNLENSTQDNNLNKETKETESPASGASESTAKVQSVDDDDDIIMTEPEDPLCL